MTKKRVHRKKIRLKTNTRWGYTRLTHLTREWGMCGTCGTCGMCWRLSSTSSSGLKNLQFGLNDPVAIRLTNNWKKNVFRSGSRGVLNFKLFLTILSHLIIKKNNLKDLHNWLTNFSFNTSIAKIEKFYFNTYFGFILHVFLP